MSDLEGIAQRLDHVIALLALGLKGQIAAALDEVRADPVAASILDETSSSWCASGDVRKRVRAKTGVSDRTFYRSLAGLESQGLLRTEGAGSSVRYRGTGLV
jgi:hypothetical protein